MDFQSYSQIYSVSLGSACLFAVITLLLFRIKAVRALAERHGAGFQWFLVIAYGLLAIYATLSAVNVNGAMMHVRDLATMFAGLVGGPIAGIGAGILGGAFRFTQGGFTQIACSLSTLLAGIIGGIIYLVAKKQVIRPVWGLLIGALVEAMHMGLVLLTSQPFDQALAVVSVLSGPFILVNAIGLWLLLYIHREINGLS